MKKIYAGDYELNKEYTEGKYTFIKEWKPEYRLYR
jgi:hypothetical protein